MYSTCTVQDMNMKVIQSPVLSSQFSFFHPKKGSQKPLFRVQPAAYTTTTPQPPHTAAAKDIVHFLHTMRYFDILIFIYSYYDAAVLKKGFLLVHFTTTYYGATYYLL